MGDNDHCQMNDMPLRRPLMTHITASVYTNARRCFFSLKIATVAGVCNQTVSRLHFPVVKNVPIDVSACAININSSISSETTKQFRYKCHELFVKSPVMITVKGFLKCRSMQ